MQRQQLKRVSAILVILSVCITAAFVFIPANAYADPIAIGGMHTFGNTYFNYDGTDTAASNDGYFSLKASKYVFGDDETSAWLEDGDQTGEETVYFDVTSSNGLGSFELEDVDVGEWEDGIYNNVYVVGYANGEEAFSTAAYSSPMDGTNQNFNIDMTESQNKIIDSFRIYYTKGAGTTAHWYFMLWSFTIKNASTDLPPNTNAPDAPNVTGTTPTNDTTPTWGWTQGVNAGNGTYRYKVNSSDLSTGATETTDTYYTPGSSLSDGTHTLYVQERDDAGNWSASGSFAITVDTSAPIGYAIEIDQAYINNSNKASMSFTFAGAEVGSTYDYTIGSTGGGTPVTGSGTVTSATQQVTGIDVSGLTDGTLAVSVTLTDAAGNTGMAATDTVDKDATAPSGYTITIDQTYINSSNVNALSFTFAGAETGSTYNYSISSSGGGTAVTGSGTVTSETQQITGIDVSVLNDGTLTVSVTLTDAAGNTGTTDTDTAIKDTVAPSGYSVTIDQTYINSSSAAALSFTFAGAEIGNTYNYTISSSGGGTPVTGSGMVTSATQQITGIDVSGLTDGKLTVIVTLTDTAGNTGTAATDTVDKDTAAPSGYTVAIDQPGIDALNVTALSFTFAGAEVGSTYSYSISSSGGGTAVTGSGTVVSATQQVTGIDVSGLFDGMLTVSVILTDDAGNAGTAASDTVEKDASAPMGYTIEIDQAYINNSNKDFMSFTFAGAEIGTTYSYSISSSGGGTAVTGSGTVSSATQQVTGIDVSGLTDGTLTVSVTLTDAGGNEGLPDTDTVVKDTAAPIGYAIAIDQPYINNSNKASMSFTFAGAEVGSTYDYTIGSSGGGTAVTGSGTVTSATQQITGIDVSGLTDGTLAVSVTLTDAAGNTGTAATDTVDKDATAPSGYTITIDQTYINSSNANALSFTFAGAETGSTYNYIISSSGGGTAVTGSGMVTSATQQVTGIDVSSLTDGTLAVSVTLTDAAGNTGTTDTDTAIKDTVAPSGYSVTIDQTYINNSSAAALSFTFAGAEIGNTYNYTISSSGGGTPVTGSGMVTSATQQIMGIDVSGLTDGTLTVIVTLTDTAGNTGTAATDTVDKDTAAPSGYTIAIDQPGIDALNVTALSFTFTGAEVGSTYSYSISSSGGGTAVTGSGTVVSATQQVTGIDVSGLFDGMLTVSVILTDDAGNAGTAASDTVEKDASAPMGYTIEIDQAYINNSNKDSMSLTFAGAEIGTTYSYSISSSGGGTAVTGSGTVSSATQQVTGIDVSGLIDGTLTVSVTLTDAGGNEGSPATDTVEKDTVVPSGYTIVIDQSRIDPLNVDALSFTFAGAEVGSTYNYSISSSSGGTPVTGSGTVALATQQITAIDVSSLPDGILTVSVILTDAAGNAGSAAVHTVEKDAVAPMGYTIAIDQAYINNSNKASMSFTFAEAEIGTTYSYSISSSGGGTAVTGSGTVSSATQQVTGINVSGLTDGTLTVSVTLTDAGGNEGLPATGTVAKDTVVPSGYTIAIEQSGIDASNVASLSFTFTGAETGSTYSYSISSSVGGTPVTGSGTVASASHKVTGIDVSGLPDGTLTVRVILTDAAGNAGAEAEKTVPKSTAPSPTGGDSNRGGSGSGTQPSSIQGQVFIDGKAQTAAIVSSKLSGGRRTTTVALDDKKIQENIGKGKDKSTLLIPASSGSPDEVTGSLNAQTIKVMQLKDSTIQIDTGSVIYTLPASKIDMEAIGAWAGKDTGLQDVKVNISVIKSISDVAKIAENTAADGGCSIVVAPVEFSITCTVGDRSTVVNRFNGYVDRMVAIPEGIDPSKITTGVILNRDGSFSHVPTVVIKQGGKDYAKMNSLTNSTYLVIWNPVTFADVESHIFKDEVNDAASRLIIDGLNDSSFGPDIKITRGEFVETIIRALGLLRTDKTTDKFKDVKPGSKYMASAAAAFEYGIVGGYGDGTFRPERLITREEAMNLIVRAMKVMGMDTEISEQSARSAVEKYADGAEVNKIAVKAAAICVRNGVFNGSSKGNLSPAENISRGQTAAVILRLLKKKELI